MFCRSIFCWLLCLLLKGLTFYNLNRGYLLMGTLYAIVYPFLDIKTWFQQDVVSHIPIVWDYVESYFPEEDTTRLSIGHLFLIALGIGGVILLSKLSVQLLSLLRIHFYSKPSKWQHYFFRNVLFPIVPFSFFNTIYIHRDQHQDPELYDIFKHEDVHVKGLHTIDILLFEMLLIGCWYNPFVWLMRRAVRQNLEFLTDQQVLDKGVDRRAYQYSLLNVTKQGTTVGIGNQFNFKTLKKRIMMMNKRRSSQIELSKYAFLLPIMILAGATFTVTQAEEKIGEFVEKIKEIPVDVVLPAAKTEQIASDQDTLKGKVVGISLDDKGLQITGDEKGFPIAAVNNGDQLFVHGRVGFEDVLTVLDGVPVTNEEMKKLPPEDIESITVLKDKSATALYGDKGKSGVILIATKKGLDTKIVKERTVQDTLSVTYRHQQKAVSVSNVLNGLEMKNNSGKNPLIVLDGKIMGPSFKLNSIATDGIEHISVLKDKSATAIYGDQGKEGVVVIGTKSFAEKTKPGPNRTWTLPPNATKEEEIEFYAKVGAGAKWDEVKANQQKIYKDDIKEVVVVGYSGKKTETMPSAQALDTQPEPEGGMAAFRKWVGNNFSYPQGAIDAGVKGTIQVAFIVEKDGSLSDVRIVRDLGYGTGENAVALIKKAPSWKPGLKNGEPVRVQYTFPIRLDMAQM